MRELEKIYGVQFINGEVRLWVLSNGCTKKESFEVEKADFNCKTPEIAINRISPDTCKMKPHVVEIIFDQSEFGISKPFIFLKVKNPFSNSIGEFNA